jgi:hypothetical protein
LREFAIDGPSTLLINMHLLDASPADSPSIQERPPKRRVAEAHRKLLAARGGSWDGLDGDGGGN